MFCGFTLGSALAGLIAARVLPGFGWRVLLVGGGLAPLVLAPVLGALLPESVRFLVMKGDAQDRIAAVLRRIGPAADLRGASFAGTTGSKASPVAQLFSGGLLMGTLLLWLAFFMSLLVVYLMTNWMPTLLQQASGASMADAARIGAMYQVGGTLGAILVGRLMDRFEPHRVLFASYLTGAACIVLISLSTQTRGADDGRGLCRGGVHFGRPGWRQRALGGLLPDGVSRDRRGLGERHRPRRIDRRVAARRHPAWFRVAGDDGVCAGRHSGRHLGNRSGDAWDRAPAPADRIDFVVHYLTGASRCRTTLPSRQIAARF